MLILVYISTMNTNNSIKTFANHNTLHQIRLVISTALVGTLASFTHGFYLGIHPMTTTEIAVASKRELETHTGIDYYDAHHQPITTEPRRVREPRRASEQKLPD